MLAVNTTLEWSFLSSLIALVSYWLILGLDGRHFFFNTWLDFIFSSSSSMGGRPDTSFLYWCYICFLWGNFWTTAKFDPWWEGFLVLRWWGWKIDWWPILLLVGVVWAVAVVVVIVVDAIGLELMLLAVVLLLESLPKTLCVPKVPKPWLLYRFHFICW